VRQKCNFGWRGPWCWLNSGVKPRSSASLVFGTSAAVLVLEILAGRLMAPYVGISLETFTGIIGTVLAGIATGSAVGGWAADTYDPRRLIGPSVLAGGAFTWLSIPIVTLLGPEIGRGPLAIVALTAMAFFLPSAVLSAISPLVAKLRLVSLADTGAVVGGLSAWATMGALVGTFITGFLLISAAPTRSIVLGIGALLVVAGIVASITIGGARPNGATVVAVALAGLGSTAVAPPCDHETSYFCVRVVEDADNASGRSLVLDRLRHAYVDLDDPTHLDVRYIRIFAAVAASRPGGFDRVLHVGGGGFSFPRYLRHVDATAYSLVLEIDPDLVEINRSELGLVTDERLEVRTGDARLALSDLADNEFDLIVGDAFGSQSVPWHLTTTEFIAELDRVLTPDGIYVMNVLDGGDSRFARAELATLRQHFEHLAAILPADGIPNREINQILLASHQPLPALALASADGRALAGDIDEYINGQAPLRDDFAPVDQLLP
jgi:spermidine synthase